MNAKQIKACSELAGAQTREATALALSQEAATEDMIKRHKAEREALAKELGIPLPQPPGPAVVKSAP